MTTYAELAVDASEAIAAAGGTITLKRIVRGAYDPVTETYATNTTQSFDINAAVLPLGEDDLTFYPDTMIDQEKTKVIMPAYGATFNPEPEITVLIGAEVWKVVKVKKLRPDGSTNIIFTLFLAK